MPQSEPSAEDRAFFNRLVEAGIRIGFIAVLVLWCLDIVRPFVQPIVWGIVIAVAAHPVYAGLRRFVGGGEKRAAALFVILALAILIGPTVSLTTSLVETAGRLSDEFFGGGFVIPPPPESVEGWPIVGESLHAAWSEASQNLEATLRRYAPQLKTAGMWLVSTGASTGFGILQFVISIVIAGVLLANTADAGEVTRKVATRLAGSRGVALVELSRATVQSVTRGILGVAVIQSLLAGLGLVVVGVPAAGLWALLVLLLAVIQLPALLVLGPAIAYVFATSSTVVAVIFAIWSLVVGGMDTFLKPMLMGRGVDVPMLVIFFGAIGGFMADGIIGLFLGAVVLALGYSLAIAWLEGDGEDALGAPAGSESQAGGG